jgi:thioredoxin 1
MSDVKNICDQEFATEVLASNAPVLVDFWAPWCGPCRLIAPLMDWAASTYGEKLKVLKMEVDPNPETVRQYKIEGIPTLILFQHGEVLERLEGAVGKPRIEAMLTPHLGPGENSSI